MAKASSMPAYELENKKLMMAKPVVVKPSGKDTYRAPASMSPSGKMSQSNAGPCGDICPGC